MTNRQHCDNHKDHEQKKIKIMLNNEQSTLDFFFYSQYIPSTQRVNIPPE